jgi:hypothetical protein
MNEIIVISPENTIEYLRSVFSDNILQDISDSIYAIERDFKGDGSGLNASGFSDKYMRKKLAEIIPSLKEIDKGDADWSINYHDLSFKKIRGKSTIALNWSKNPKGAKVKDLFENDIMLMISKTCQWWKKNPREFDPEIDYAKSINRGFYIIDKYYLKQNINLGPNNKSNNVISEKQLYLAVINSLERDLFIEMPKPLGIKTFNILKAFD